MNTDVRKKAKNDFEKYIYYAYFAVPRDVQLGLLGQFYADKNHTKISREYSAIKRWLRCRDILHIQK